jgi:predicted nucleic acid-binding protein
VNDLVLDASVTLSLCFPEERTPSLLALQDSFASRAAIVPPLWWYEVSNALLQAKRRARLPGGDVEPVMKLIRGLPLITDALGLERLFDSVFALAEQYKLTVYDASYLELAIRRQLPLATLDEALRSAASSAGVPLEAT